MSLGMDILYMVLDYLKHLTHVQRGTCSSSLSSDHAENEALILVIQAALFWNISFTLITRNFFATNLRALTLKMYLYIGHIKMYLHITSN